MRLIVAIGVGDAGEQILILLAGQQIAVIQRVLAEQRQQFVAGMVGDDGIAARLHRFAVARFRRRRDRLACARGHTGQHITLGNQFAVSWVGLVCHR